MSQYIAMPDGARPYTSTLIWFLIACVKALVLEWFIIAFLNVMIMDTCGHSTAKTLIRVIFVWGYIKDKVFARNLVY